jgi:hypothetical protein
VPLSVFVVGMAAGTLPRRLDRPAPRAARRVRCGHRLRRARRPVGRARHPGRLSFPLYCAATFLGGLYAAVVQSFRFAAAAGASAGFRPKGALLGHGGGVFAGVLGPQLVTWTMHLWPPDLFAASLAQGAVALVAMAVLAGVDLPRPRGAELRVELVAGRPLGVIAGQPRFMGAVVCGVVSIG